MDYDLGFFDRDEGRVEPAPNPFVPEKVLTMSPTVRVKVVVAGSCGDLRFGVKNHDANRSPVARGPAPAFRIEIAGALV